MQVCASILNHPNRFWKENNLCEKTRNSAVCTVVAVQVHESPMSFMLACAHPIRIPLIVFVTTDSSFTVLGGEGKFEILCISVVIESDSCPRSWTKLGLQQTVDPSYCSSSSSKLQ